MSSEGMLDKKYGTLTVIKKVESTRYRHDKWKVRCSKCKKSYVVIGPNLRSGNTDNCKFCSYNSRRVFTKENIDTALMLREKGYTFAKIGKYFGCSGECAGEAIRTAIRENIEKYNIIDLRELGTYVTAEIKGKTSMATRIHIQNVFPTRTVNGSTTPEKIIENIQQVKESVYANHVQSIDNDVLLYTKVLVIGRRLNITVSVRLIGDEYSLYYVISNDLKRILKSEVVHQWLLDNMSKVKNKKGE